VVSEERARVIAVSAGQATVEMEPSARCGGCGLCAGTGAGKMRLRLEALDGLEPGQVVIVAVERAVSLRSVGLLLGLPLLGLVGGAVLGHAHPVLGLSPDGSSVLLAIALLGLAFFVALLYDRKVASRTAPRPTILRVEKE